MAVPFSRPDGQPPHDPIRDDPREHPGDRPCPACAAKAAPPPPGVPAPPAVMSGPARQPPADQESAGSGALDPAGGGCWEEDEAAFLSLELPPTNWPSLPGYE